MNTLVNIAEYRPGAVNKRLFSLERANRSLPLVRRITEDIRQAWGKVADYQEEFEKLAERGDSERAQQSMLALSKARQEYREFCRELGQLGCCLSDGHAGAVDFPAIVGGKQVVLSWRLGESAISRWQYPGQRA